jgi:hypothetical protein
MAAKKKAKKTAKRKITKKFAKKHKLLAGTHGTGRGKRVRS